MKEQNATKMPFNGVRSRLLRGNEIACLFAAGLLGTLAPLHADMPDTSSGIQAPSGSYSAPSDIVAPSGTYASPDTSFSPTSTPSHQPFMQGGHLPFAFVASVSEVYDDNIFIQPIKTSDYITQITLLGEYKVGNDSGTDTNYFDIYYSPSVDIYANHSSQDSFNQTAGALYQHRFSKLTMGIEQTYSRESESQIAAGNLVTSSVYVTKASANYDYSDKLSLVASATQTVTDYETAGFSNSYEWDLDTYFLYHLDPKLSIGFGPKVGWLDVGMAPNQSFQQLLARVNYLYSGKLSFDLDVGGEIREYQGSSTGDTATPVFGLGLTYSPFINTTLTLRGDRDYMPSYNMYGQNYVATSVSFSGRQRFFQNYYFDLGFGYENDSYEGAGIALTGPARSDNYFYGRTGVDWNPNSWFQASVYYKYQNDDSNFGVYSFEDNQVGVSAAFSY